MDVESLQVGSESDFDAFVFCRLTFEAMHRFEDAPMTVRYLSNLHRHVFHVELRVRVSSLDREVEFILLKDEVKRRIERFKIDSDTDVWSCEHWCVALMRQPWGIQTGSSPAGRGPVYADRVVVSEDGENGAVVERRAVPGSDSDGQSAGS